MVSAIGDIFIFEGGERHFRKTNQKWEINKIKAERTQQKSILRPVAVLYEAIKFFNRLVFPQVLQWFTIFLSFFFLFRFFDNKRYLRCISNFHPLSKPESGINGCSPRQDKYLPLSSIVGVNFNIEMVVLASWDVCKENGKFIYFFP